MSFQREKTEYFVSVIELFQSLGKVLELSLSLQFACVRSIVVRKKKFIILRLSDLSRSR